MNAVVKTGICNLLFSGLKLVLRPSVVQRTVTKLSSWGRNVRIKGTLPLISLQSDISRDKWAICHYHRRSLLRVFTQRSGNEVWGTTDSASETPERPAGMLVANVAAFVRYS